MILQYPCKDSSWSKEPVKIPVVPSDHQTLCSLYPKYPNLVRTQIEIISDSNYLVRILFERQFSRYLPNLVHTSFLLYYSTKTFSFSFVTSISQNFVIYKILNTLKLFWFTINSSLLLNEEVQFFFHDIYHFFVSIAHCIKLCKRII